MIILPCLPMVMTFNYIGAVFLLAFFVGGIVLLLKRRK